MIESGVILLVLLLGAALFVVSRVAAQNAQKDPAAELARLRESLAWHEQRLLQAKEKNWDYEMINRITEQLEDTRFELARINGAQATAAQRE